MDLRTTTDSKPIPHSSQHSTVLNHGQFTPSPSPDTRMFPRVGNLIKDHVEIWDYVAGARFRGFVADKEDMRTMFVFLDKQVAGMDLKPGLMSLLELASSEHLDCNELVLCVERTAETSESAEEFKDLNRSLAWVGFELTMLEEWAGAEGCISDRYVFLSMDV